MPPPPAVHDALLRRVHWTVATLIVVGFALGLAQDAFPRAMRDGVLRIHEWLGLLVLLLLALRLARRAQVGVPPEIAMPRWQRMAARASHVGLYVLMAAMPLAGLVDSWVRGRTVSLFGIVALPSLVGADRGLVRTVNRVHELLAWALIALAAVHAAAALYHHHVLRDDVLVRMLPRLRRPRAR